MLGRIEASIESLSTAEQKVARLILNNPKTFVKTPVAEIATTLNISKPTVVRCCRSLGYEGLADFKEQLAKHLSFGVPFVHHAIDSRETPYQAAQALIDSHIDELIRLRQQLAEDPLRKAIAILSQAIEGKQRINIFGQGNSGIVAKDAEHKFFRFGVQVMSCHDPHIQTMAVSLLTEGDCVLLISNSGRSREMLELANMVRHKQSALIAITSSQSPLAQAVDVTLSADHQENFGRYSPMASRLLHLTLIDILTAGVAMQLSPPYHQSLEEMNQILNEKRRV